MYNQSLFYCVNEIPDWKVSKGTQVDPVGAYQLRAPSMRRYKHFCCPEMSADPEIIEIEGVPLYDPTIR